MSNSSTKTPWHLRFAPGAILRPIGRLVSKAVSLASAIIQPIRQRLNQWNWRKKTALVTALAITAAGVFYQQRTHAAAFLGPILATKSGDFFVKFFVGYALNKALEASFSKKLRKTADATPDGEPLYSNREFYERDYDVDESGTKTENYRVDAKADALFHKAYNTTGIDSRLDPSTLDQRQVIDLVDSNLNLNTFDITYAVLELRDGSWSPLYEILDRRRPDENRYLVTYTDRYGGYVQPLTDEEIQEDMDKFRRNWYNPRARWRWPVTVGPLKKGHVVGRTEKKYVCDKELRLWSKFKFIGIPGNTGPNPKQLQTPGGRPTYVTELSYTAREAGYRGYIVTKVPKNEKPFVEYPKPRSYNNHSYMEHDLDSIIWANYKIIGEPNWIGSATRYYNSKSAKWCNRHNKKYGFRCRLSWSCTSKKRYEYKLFQNESVEEPSN